MFNHWKLLHKHVHLLDLSMDCQHFCMHVIHNLYIVVSPQLLSPASRSLKSMYGGGDIAPQIIDLI